MTKHLDLFSMRTFSFKCCC